MHVPTIGSVTLHRESLNNVINRKGGGTHVIPTTNNATTNANISGIATHLLHFNQIKQAQTVSGGRTRRRRKRKMLFNNKWTSRRIRMARRTRNLIR